MKSHSIKRHQALAIACLVVLVGLSAVPGCAVTHAAEEGAATVGSSSGKWQATMPRGTVMPTEAVGPQLTGPVNLPAASASAGAADRATATAAGPSSRVAAASSARGDSPQMIAPPARMAEATAASRNSATPAPQSFPLLPMKPANPAARLASRSTAPAVMHVSAANFDRHVLQSDMPVLVDFYATWCGPCQAMSPAIQQLAAENPQVKVVKVDIDDSPELAARYGIRSIPSLLVFKEGQVVATQKGVANPARLRDLLDL